jgi:hypothetical protein
VKELEKRLEEEYIEEFEKKKLRYKDFLERKKNEMKRK